jgi:hypothetical protein
MRFFPNLETEEGRALAREQGLLPATTPYEPPAPTEPATTKAASAIAEWRRTFGEALTGGDQASAVQTNTEYDYDLSEHRKKPAFPEPMYDFHIDGREQRIDWAQAQYLRAIAVAAGQSATEAHELGRKMDGLGSALADGLRELTAKVETLADPLGQIAVWVADSGDTQDKMVGALELIAGALTAVNVRADLAESKATFERESGREAQEAAHRRRAETVRELRTNLAALAWWQWLRRHRIERQLVAVALELVK